jgi:hypothetical protein
MPAVPIRKEVLEFLSASETILSSVLIKPPLTKDERDLITEYVKQLSAQTEQWKKEVRATRAVV